MNCRVVDMRHKEVINSRDGTRLGCVDDVEVNTCDARLVAIVVYGRPRCFGLFGREDDLIIGWEHIDLIGEDTILVSDCPSPKRKKKFHFPFFS